MGLWFDQIEWQLMLLAAGPRWRSMGSGFRGRRARLDSSDLITGLVIFAGIVVAVILLSRFMARQDGRKHYNSPRALFRSLAKAHGLDWASRRLLRQVARWQRLAHPARLFLEPSRYDPVNLSPQLRERLGEIHALRDRIFAATIEDLDLDRPGGQTPTDRKRAAAERASSPTGKSKATPVVEPTKSAGSAARSIPTDAPNLVEEQSIGTP